MGVLSALYNGFDGLNVMGGNMQVLSDNVSNVNSVAYKAQSSRFQEVMASAQDPLPIGNGAALSSIDTNFNMGSIEKTTVSTDMAISGSGFYMLRDSSASEGEIYSRDGQFELKQIDTESDTFNLVSNMGHFLQGTNINSTSSPTAAGTVEDILIRKKSLAQATNSIQLAVNIQHDTSKIEQTDIPLYEMWDGTKMNGDQPAPLSSSDYDYSSTISIYDSSGDAHDLSIYYDSTSTDFQKEFLITSNPLEDMRATSAGPTKGAGALLYGIMDFTSTGQLQSISSWNVPADTNVNHTDLTTPNLVQLARGEEDYGFTHNFNGTDSTTTINFGTTATAQSTTSTVGARKNLPPLTPEMITSNSSWSSVYDSSGNQVANGDVMSFTGTSGDGTAVSYSYTIDTTMKVSDLLDKLETEFQATASVIDGKLQLTDTEVGTSQLAVSSITYADSNGDNPGVNTNLAQVFGTQGASLETVSGSRYINRPTTTTSYSSESYTLSSFQDGYASSILEDIVVSSKGVISGVYAGGREIEQARVSLARFTNVAGLRRVGEGVLSMTAEAGKRTVDSAGESGLGGIIGQSLEMSNVDLGHEFTNLIQTQRGFQANSKTITTADEFYQEALSMKR